MTDTIAAATGLTEVLEAVESGVFSPGERDRFAAITMALRSNDWFMVAADFQAYYDTQRRVADLWRDPAAWWRASLLNTANMGWFSSDRTIREYAEQLWGLQNVGESF
jgi:starch phosphorylase